MEKTETQIPAEIQKSEPKKSNMLKELVDSVQQKIDALASNNEIQFPLNYSVGNALRSAWLIIQETVDINKRPALEVCTRDSVANALFNTVVQGLSPAKKQVYYIVYGNQLQAMRSYFGTVACAKRLNGVKDIFADVVYKGNGFEIAKEHGTWIILRHESSFENIDTANIVAAYCTVVFEDDTKLTEVMNWAQIQKSWSKSKMDKVQKEFPDQMAKRTVINRALKMVVNTSDDNDLIIQAFDQTGDRYEPEPVAQLAEDNRASDLNAELFDESTAAQSATETKL